MQQPITICQIIKMSVIYSKIRDFFQTGKFTHRRPTFDTAEKATMLIYLETQYVHIIKSIITEQIPRRLLSHAYTPRTLHLSSETCHYRPCLVTEV